MKPKPFIILFILYLCTLPTWGVEISFSNFNYTIRDNLWQSFLNPPDSIRVGCYYYWVNEQVDPKGVKADRYFHAGINATILHVMISQPGDNRKPAVRPWFGTWFDRRSKNAKELKPLVTYLRRCNFMLQLGHPLNGAPDTRQLDDGTTIHFTTDSQFEIVFPDGKRELWNPETIQP